jgi:hypothetical protein
VANWYFRSDFWDEAKKPLNLYIISIPNSICFELGFEMFIKQDEKRWLQIDAEDKSGNLFSFFLEDHIFLVIFITGHMPPLHMKKYAASLHSSDN